MPLVFIKVCVRVCLSDVVHGDAVDQSCVWSLQQIKASLQEAHGSYPGPLAPGCSGIDVSWGECATHLLTQLTQAQDDEAWTVLNSLPDLVNLSIYTILYCAVISMQAFHFEQNHSTFCSNSKRLTVHLSNLN